MKRTFALAAVLVVSVAGTTSHAVAQSAAARDDAAGDGASSSQIETAPAPEPSAPSADDAAGLTLQGGVRISGRVAQAVPGVYAVVARPDGKLEAVEWAKIVLIDGKPPPPVPPTGAGSLIPPGFTPDGVAKLTEQGRKFSELAPGLLAPRDGKQLIGSIQGAQDALEQVGLKRGPPNGFLVGWPMVMMPLCFEMRNGTLGRVDGTGWFGGGCKYIILPIGVALLVASPFVAEKVPDPEAAAAHHVEASIYALDYSKKSALTGSFARQPTGGGLLGNLGYDLGYTYIHPRYGALGYGHLTLQQTGIASTEYVRVSSSFFKADLQAGIDFVRLLSGGKKRSYWAQHTAYVRAGPSLFHNWILSRDVSGPGRGAYVYNPLNNSVPLVTGVGYEVAAEVDFRFPLWLGGVHFKFERGSYPLLDFPELNARDGAFVALIGFDDLRAGDTYTWQRLKLELELPLNYSRLGGIFLGGQLAKYENNFGSGVNNRGLSLDYRWRF